MTENRKNEFLSLSLAHAGELAYAEEAPGTCALLGHLNGFFRYLCSYPERVILKDEIKACESYVAIQHISTPSTLTVQYKLAEGIEETLVTRFSVIDLLDRYIAGRRESQSVGVTARLAIGRITGGGAVTCELYADDGAVPEIVETLT